MMHITAWSYGIYLLVFILISKSFAALTRWLNLNLTPKVLSFFFISGKSVGPNQSNNADIPINQSELEVNTCSRRQAREKGGEQVTISFGFNSDWLIKWREIF